jgi:hypothetical protein
VARPSMERQLSVGCPANVAQRVIEGYIQGGKFAKWSLEPAEHPEHHYAARMNTMFNGSDYRVYFDLFVEDPSRTTVLVTVDMQRGVPFMTEKILTEMLDDVGRNILPQFEEAIKSGEASRNSWQPRV